MLHPMLGVCRSLTGLPASTASSAAQISPRHRHSISRPARVHLAAIDQPLLLVEHVEIRRARRAIRLRHRLRLVVQIRKRIPSLFRLMHHLLRRIGRVRADVVRADPHHGRALGLIVLGQLRQPIGHVLHVRAMVAHEDNQQRRRFREIRQRHGAAIDIRQREIRRLRAQRQHRAGS